MINNIIINGFDRCGSTAIVKTLNSLNKVEIIMHPFNNGSIRRKMYSILTDNNVSSEDKKFFNSLENNELYKPYIKSIWHEKYSTVNDFRKSKLHILKTTINHFTIHWIQEHYPKLEFWGIWRDPLGILASIIRNNYYQKWYSDALEKITSTVMSEEILRSRFEIFINQLEDEKKITSFLIAVRSYYFFYHLGKHKLINYELYRNDPNVALESFVRYFNLPKSDFTNFLNIDFNIVGKKFDKHDYRKDLFTKKDRLFYDKLFSDLNMLMLEKFNIKPAEDI